MKEQREGFVQFPSCYGVTYKFQIKKPTRQQAFLILENRKTSQKWYGSLVDDVDAPPLAVYIPLEIIINYLMNVLKHQQRLASTIDTGTSSNTSSSTRTGTQTNADLFVQNDGCLVLELQLQAQVYGCFWSPRYRFHLRPLFAHDPIEIEAAVAAAIAIGIEKEKKKEQLKRKGEQMMMMTCDEEELPQSRPEEQDPLRPWKKQRSYH